MCARQRERCASLDRGFEPGRPGTQASACLRRKCKEDRLRIDIPDICLKLPQVHVARSCEVDLVDEDDVCLVEHDGIFFGLLGTLSNTADDDAEALPKIERSRTNEIANIFDNQQVELVDWKRVHRTRHHPRIEVTYRPRCDLEGRDSESLNALGIEIRLQVTFDDRDTELSVKSPERRFEQRRFARARCRHQVHHEQALVGKAGAVRRGRLLVGVQYIGLD